MNSFLSNWTFYKVWNVSSRIHICEAYHLCWVFIDSLENPTSNVQPSHNTFWIWFNWIIDRFGSKIKSVSFIYPCCQIEWFSVVKGERCFHLDMKDFVFSFFLMHNFILDHHIVKFLHRIVFHKEINNFLKFEVDDGLSPSDYWISVGFFFITFDFSISNRFPTLSILELFDLL